MPTITITVPKVRCIKRNDKLNKDKVFLVVIVTAIKQGDEAPKIIFSGLSNVLKVKKGAIHSLDLGSKWSFNIEDNEGFNISFGLYEKDKGDVYDAYKEKIEEIITTDGMSFRDVIREVWNAVKEKLTSADLKEILEVLPAVGIKIIKNLRQDDLLGSRTYSYEANNPEIGFVREHDLKEAHSHYELQLALTPES